MAALKSGITTVLIPQENVRDLEEVDDVVKNSIKFIPCENAAQVLKYALTKKSYDKKEIIKSNNKNSKKSARPS